MMKRSVLMLLTLLVLGCQEHHTEPSLRTAKPEETELFQTQILQDDVNDLARPVDVEPVLFVAEGLNADGSLVKN